MGSIRNALKEGRGGKKKKGAYSFQILLYCIDTLSCPPGSSPAMSTLHGGKKEKGERGGERMSRSNFVTASIGDARVEPGREGGGEGRKTFIIPLLSHHCTTSSCNNVGGAVEEKEGERGRKKGREHEFLILAHFQHAQGCPSLLSKLWEGGEKGRERRR